MKIRLHKKALNADKFWATIQMNICKVCLVAYNDKVANTEECSGYRTYACHVSDNRFDGILHHLSYKQIKELRVRENVSEPTKFNFVVKGRY